MSLKATTGSYSQHMVDDLQAAQKHLNQALGYATKLNQVRKSDVKGHPVLVENMVNKKQRQFPSIRAAARFLNRNESSIRHSLKHRGVYYWQQYKVSRNDPTYQLP